MSSLTSGKRQLQNNSISKMFGSSLFRLLLICPSAFFKEFSLGGQNREKRQNEKYEPSRFGERASLKRDFVKL